MDLTLLPVLKEKLLKEKKLANIWEYFMDHFGDHMEFIDKSEKIEAHAEIQQLLTQVTPVLFKGPVKIAHFLIMGFREEHFYHGVASTSKGNVSFMYFDDIRVGSTLHIANFHSGETRFSRIVCEVLADGRVKAAMN